MKKKIIIAIVLVVVILIAGFLIIKARIGDIRPALLPPKEDLTEIIEKYQVGDETPFTLSLPDGFKIGVFAKNLGKARDLEFSPGGSLLLSVPPEGKVVALPDKDSDGRADKVKNVLTNLNNPHGLAFHKNKLFVVEETRVNRYGWDEENLKATFEKTLFTLPSGGRHSTRTISIKEDGTLFISIGSTCDTCFEKNEWLAAVVISDVDGKSPRVFARGLRNAVFITLNTSNEELWGTEMGRDFLGDFLPPDEINIIRVGKDYGWPTCYGNRMHDEKFNHQHLSGECSGTESSAYDIAAHSSPLGLAFIDSKQFPQEWQGDLLVAYHGSWNRSTPIGYEIVRVKVEGNKVTGEEKFLTGFLKGSEGLGRPVDVIFDKEGSLYISDDKVGAVYKVSKD